MMRADTYDEMAELEALLDEYARLEVLDPSKLPGLAARIWSAIERANLQADLDIHERPDDVGTLVEHIDGYLCEVKDIQIKDGLHVLGRAPRGRAAARARVGHAAARLGRRAGPAPRRRRGVRARRAGAGGGGAARRSQQAPDGLVERFRGPAPARATSSTASRTRTWRCSTRSPRATGRASAAAEVCAEVLGLRRRRRRARAALRLRRGRPADPAHARRADRRRARAARPPHRRPGPRARRPGGASTCCRPGATSTASTRARCPRSCRGRSAGGSPTRCSTATGPRPATLPRMVGLVAWGTAAMRTQGDDVAEILALLGVRPTWHPESKRVTGHRGHARSPSSAVRAST